MQLMIRSAPQAYIKRRKLITAPGGRLRLLRKGRKQGMFRRSGSRHPARRFLIPLTLFGAVAAIVFLSGGASAVVLDSSTGPTIWTDQADYPPGAAVTLSGAGWTSGEAIHLDVNDALGKTWSYSNDVTADNAG